MNTQILQEDLREIVKTPVVSWSLLEGKTLLITGGNGMLGSYLIETVLYLNDHVFRSKATILCLSRNQKRARKRFEHHENRGDLKFIIQDVRDPIEYDGPIDFIIHAASQASPQYYGKDPVGTLEANVVGTRHLLQLALQKNVTSFLFISTSEVYGVIETPAGGIKEEHYGYLDPAMVRACYAESKRLGETMCISYHHQYDVPVRIARPFHTYGPSMRLDDGRVYADFVKNIVAGEDIHLNSDGSAQRAFCYITDATIGFFHIMLKGEEAQAYNLGNPDQEVSIFELAQTLTKLFPNKDLKVTRKELSADYLQSVVSRNFPNIEKLQALGWTPCISIKEGFKRTIEGVS